MRRRVGFQRFYVFVIQLLCAGAWVLSDFMHSESFFVRMRVGFERFYDSVIQLLCAGAWVLSDCMHYASSFVRRRVGFVWVLGDLMHSEWFFVRMRTKNHSECIRSPKTHTKPTRLRTKEDA